MDVLTEYRVLRKQGCRAEALAFLGKHLRRLECNSVATAGKMLEKDLPLGRPDLKPLRVLIMGQCTTTYLAPMIRSWAWAEGLRLELRDGGYDQVVQELLALGPSEAPDVVLLLPWSQRLLAPDDRNAEERIEDEMAFLEQSWAQVARLKCKFIQVSYDWVGTGALGYSLSARRGGAISLVQRTNASLQAALPPGTFFVDLESLSAWHGKSRFYDERNYHWLKQPFSTEGISIVGRKIAAGLRALTQGRRKVLVLDLDNTLWGGVVGETGPAGIALSGTGEGEAFAAFQQHVRDLKNSGVLLAVCSKNNEADAREPFEANDQMLLKLDDFAAFHASWDGKPSRIRRIAEELNLGLESFVFFDDNPAEREHVRAELPEVFVIEVPSEPAHYLRALQESYAFEAVDITAADAERSTQYQAEASRQRACSSAGSAQDYLASLAMVADVRPIEEGNLNRVVDLVTKTNQFNLTTRRHSRTAIESLIATPGGVSFVVNLADRFGEYGLISVVLAIPAEPGILKIDTWLMSCRAMGRTVEHFVMNHLVRVARQAGYERLLGEYLPTSKNAPVKDLLPSLGFKESAPGRGFFFELALKDFFDLPTEVCRVDVTS